MSKEGDTIVGSHIRSHCILLPVQGESNSRLPLHQQEAGSYDWEPHAPQLSGSQLWGLEDSRCGDLLTPRVQGNPWGCRITAGEVSLPWGCRKLLGPHNNHRSDSPHSRGARNPPWLEDCSHPPALGWEGSPCSSSTALGVSLH